MANRLYNKQVTPKGYSTGGRIEKVPGGYSKEGSGRISDKGLKGRSPTEAFKSYGKYDGKPIELKDGGRTKKMTESQKQAAKDAPEKVKSFVKGFLKRSPLNIKGAIEGYAGLAKDIKNRMGKKIGGRIEKVPVFKRRFWKNKTKIKTPGLAKLPTQVRNKMGYMKDGGKVMRKAGLNVGETLKQFKDLMTGSKDSKMSKQKEGLKKQIAEAKAQTRDRAKVKK
jgi:hypothetical protein